MHMTLFQIMVVLRDGPREAGVAIALMRRLVAAGEVPSVPSFYRHLRRGMEAGWIEVEGTAEEEGPGRPARSYRLTPAGVAALRARGKELEALTRLALKGPELRRG